MLSRSFTSVSSTVVILSNNSICMVISWSHRRYQSSFALLQYSTGIHQLYKSQQDLYKLSWICLWEKLRSFVHCYFQKKSFFKCMNHWLMAHFPEIKEPMTRGAQNTNILSICTTESYCLFQLCTDETLLK